MIRSSSFSSRASTLRSTYAITVAKNRSPQITQRNRDVAGRTLAEVIQRDYIRHVLYDSRPFWDGPIAAVRVRPDFGEAGKVSFYRVAAGTFRVYGCA